MNLTRFSVNTTNVFPMANTTTGGQLLTEYNLKSRESVSTSEQVEYYIGQSYVHSEKDFYVRYKSDNSQYFKDAVPISTSEIEIAPGRAVVNGHYVESLVPIIIDLKEENIKLAAKSEPTLSGTLCVGIKVMYSTLQSISGSIDTEFIDDDGNEVFKGLQIVILPKDQFHLPTSKFEHDGVEIDCGTEVGREYVTADLLLATFSYINGSIKSIENNYPNKCHMFDVTRISNIDGIVSDAYVKKTGLNPKRLYTYAGKGTNPETGYDTWCDSTDSLMIWDNSVPEYTSDMPTTAKAQFTTNRAGKTILRVPHKQVDGMQDGEGNPQYFAPVDIELPLADFAAGTAGTVDKKYTKQVKNVISKINNMYQLTNGHQVHFLDELETIDDLPAINPAWNVGDYVLVARDKSIVSNLNDILNLTPPSTLYVILPGYVRSINTGVLEQPTGVELDIKYMDSIDEPTEHPESLTDAWDLSDNTYRGQIGVDYFKLEYTTYETGEDDTETAVTTSYYFTVATNENAKEYSEPIQLTAQVPFADETLVGGFLNVPDTATDYGYVYLDDDGHLRLRDYALLRSGTLAYQLGEDFVVPTGITIDEIQAYLDEYVNQRIAFPNVRHSQTAENPNVITITITLPEDEDGGTIDIYDIDTRFNTAVNINIFGNAANNITVNISDCAKVKINPAISGTPVINLYRSCLYYNSVVLGYLNNIVDMSLWYEKYSDADYDLTVDGMTVKVDTSNGAYRNLNTSSMEYWTPDTPNDNHYTVATKSITYNPSGMIVGCSVMVRNESTSNVEVGKKTFSHYEFALPQGPALFYPVNRLIAPIYVDGQFISAYTTQSPQGYIIQDTKFSLKTPHFDIIGNQIGAGDIAFINDAYQMDVANPDDVDEWDSKVFHHFSGVTEY